jgi:hypothetical protein
MRNGNHDELQEWPVLSGPFDDEIDILITANRLSRLNDRLLPSAAMLLARTILTDGVDTCDDCLGDVLDEFEKTNPEYFLPKPPEFRHIVGLNQDNSGISLTVHGERRSMSLEDDYIDYLELPDHLYDRDGDDEPEPILIDPEQDYVKANVIVLSRRAAQFIEFFRAMITSPDELRHFADLMEGEELSYNSKLVRLYF